MQLAHPRTYIRCRDQTNLISHVLIVTRHLAQESLMRLVDQLQSCYPYQWVALEFTSTWTLFILKHHSPYQVPASSTTSFLKTARELDASLNSAVDHDTGRALLSFLTVFTCPFSPADHLRNCFLVAWHSIRLPRA